MIKIAFVKFGGMAIGGTEKVLQTIASELPKDRFQVDYYYCDAAPYIGSDYKHIDTDPSRVEYCKNNGVNLVKFNVQFKNITVPTHDWVNTNFWDVFDEEYYDVIVSGRSGHPEYPFYLIKKTPIVDTIHLAGMAENKPNVYKTVLISNEQRERWVSAGGPRNKSMIIPNPLYIPEIEEKYSYNQKFIFGLHQRNDDGIFSSIPLEAYKKIENDETMFLLLGGSERYKQQAQTLGIKNIEFLPTTADLLDVHKFLNTLSVYAHGRADGEQCSCAIIEAMSHGIPMISHVAPSMGQAEQIDNAGAIVSNSDEYADVMKRLMRDSKYYETCCTNSIKRYNSVYSLNSVMTKYIELFEEIANV